MGNTDWTPAFKQGIIDRMINGETARQISNDLHISRTNVQRLYDDFVANGNVSQINPEVVIKVDEKNTFTFPDEYIQPLWEGFLKQNDVCTMKHAYYSPDHRFYVDTCASKWMKDIVKELFLAKTPFKDLTQPEKDAIGFVVKDINKYGKIHRLKETK